MRTDYASCVFINCPFDELYLPILYSIVFAIFDCGFIPRCALEIDDSGEVRISKILKLIECSKFGIHDISRTEIDPNSQLPRFNMALELGVFIGAKTFGTQNQRQKRCLILDIEQYRYQAFISDIAGQDIRAHNNDPTEVITYIRNWLNSSSGRITIPGGSEINRRYRDFKQELPNICSNIPIEQKELTYNDYCNLVSEWLKSQ